MNRWKVVLCSLVMSMFMYAPIGVYAEHVHKVELQYGQFTAESQALKVDVPSTLHFEVRNAEDSAGVVYYKLYRVDSFLGVDDDGKEEIVKWDAVVASGAVHMGEPDRIIEKEVQPGKYYIYLTTAQWLPAFNGPTCHAEASLRIA